MGRWPLTGTAPSEGGQGRRRSRARPAGPICRSSATSRSKGAAASCDTLQGTPRRLPCRASQFQTGSDKIDRRRTAAVVPGRLGGQGLPGREASGDGLHRQHRHRRDQQSAFSENRAKTVAAHLVAPGVFRRLGHRQRRWLVQPGRRNNDTEAGRAEPPHRRSRSTGEYRNGFSLCSGCVVIWRPSWSARQWRG